MTEDVIRLSRYRHKVMVEITFNRAMPEKDAVAFTLGLLRSGNPEIAREYVGATTRRGGHYVRTIVAKSGSRVLAAARRTDLPPPRV